MDLDRKQLEIIDVLDRRTTGGGIWKGRTESYFILFLKLNYHQTRCFSFGLR